ncbi:acyloxyacyl hydrolase [Ichthyenterobacterium sp. W332]|uniref:Acyloxyacyl hydrolase n=1 Tax=Microcosmobacter mediterraneus TaxID=3075607 RepID=A0ABU2YMC0_9FLAO|nr:acyloxyacyl hydrolase [Ichthyenterobacterium sp. W332]MDT0559309.1 acyloxyacyl hydrolase [Ichthyenterobacterium sp. W332]
MISTNRITSLNYSRKNNFILVILVSLFNVKSFSQELKIHKDTSSFFGAEILVGKTMEANTDFPETNLQLGFNINYTQNNITENKLWAPWLGFPKTGISFGIYDFGNTEKIGRAYTLMPFMEFNISKKWNLYTGVGLSFMDTQFNTITNPFNKAITTDLNWSFKSFFYYNLFKLKSTDFRLGLGYVHHSNGHTRLPNQGLNSFLASIAASFKSSEEQDVEELVINKTPTRQTYYSVRAGLGQNVLSEVFNDKKEVYSFAVSAGRIHNNTFKFGGGIYYRFYEHYYDYIKNDEELVNTMYPHFREDPFAYASNLGIFGTAELLLGHIGIEVDFGLNISKPFYKIDWMLNQGYDFVNSQGETIVVLGELDTYYEIKRTISSKLGLKYYFISNDKTPKHNFFIGAHINANLGQADFTELSFGYVRRFNLFNKK